MGLIKSAASAIGSTMHDQWKEEIRCEDIVNEILIIKKKTPKLFITNKSTIIFTQRQLKKIYNKTIMLIHKI